MKKSERKAIQDWFEKTNNQETQVFSSQKWRPVSNPQWKFYTLTMGAAMHVAATAMDILTVDL